jgi:hypothetical protein
LIPWVEEPVMVTPEVVVAMSMAVTSCGSRAGASRFLTGLVACLATHDGVPTVARAAWWR